MKRLLLCLIWVISTFFCLPLQAHHGLETSFQAYPGLQAVANVRDIAYQPGGGVWLLNHQGEVVFFDGHQTHPLSDVLSLPEEKVTAIAFAHDALWMAGQNFIYRYQSGQHIVTRYRLPQTVLARQSDAQSRLANINGELWHISDGQLSRYVVEDNSFSIWRAGQWRAELTWMTNEHRLIAIGQALYQVSEQGIHQIRRFNSSITAITGQDSRAWVSTHNAVYLLALDEDSVTGQHILTQQGGFHYLASGAGGVWAANEQGLFLLSLDGSASPVWTPGQSAIDGTRVTFLRADAEGGIWFSTDQSLRYRAAGQRWIAHQHGPFPQAITQGFSKASDPWLLRGRHWRDLNGRWLARMPDQNGDKIKSAARQATQLWWSTENGVAGLDTRTGSRLTLPEPVANFAAEHLYTDAAGTLWLAKGPQLIRYWPASETVVDYGTGWQVDEGDVEGFYDDGRGSVWIRQQQGLTRYRDGQFQAIRLPVSLLPLSDLYSDERGRLWLASAQGIYQYDHTTPDTVSAAYLSLNNEQFHCITGNKDGVWAYSNQAIVHIAPRGVVRTFRLPTPMGQVVCRVSNPHQLTIFSGAERFVINTDQLAFSLRKPPKVVIGAVWQQDRRWRIAPRQQTAMTLLENNPTQLEWGSWPPERQVSRVHYQLIAKRHPGNPMAGQLAAWQQTSSDTITLANMAGGEYQLRIAIPRDGASHTVLNLDISLPMLPLMLSGAILAVFVSIVLLAVGLAFKQRYQARQQSKRLQQHRTTQPIFDPIAAQPDAVVVEMSGHHAKRRAQCQQLRSAWISRFMQAVENGFTNPDFSTHELAAALAMSERNLQRKCRQYFHITVTSYITQKRLTYASGLLKQGMSITETAEACGYRDPAYFSQRFKGYFGVSPSQYRDRILPQVLTSPTD